MYIDEPFSLYFSNIIGTYVKQQNNLIGNTFNKYYRLPIVNNKKVIISSITVTHPTSTNNNDK